MYKSAQAVRICGVPAAPGARGQKARACSIWEAQVAASQEAMTGHGWHRGKETSTRRYLSMCDV